MKFKKTLALALSALMLMSSAVVATSAASDDSEAVGAYSNQTFLETEANNAYNEQNLGATYSAASTTFKMWSPKASSVKVKLYKTGSDKESGAGVINEYAMTPNSTTGVWSLTLPGDHKNQYYTYLVTVNGTTNETQDIYSKAVGVNGKRSMIVDLDSTDPDGWNSDQHVFFNGAQEAVVWEVHVRDFSIAANSGVSEDNKGGYLAFTEGGTKLNGDANGISTCVDYLVEQGINCVQLQPVYDFESVDEEAGASSTNRNWGYDPMNYNVPEGSYSSNPFDGNVRIKEFKQMVQALHDRGISVVMDVVYNHTYATEGSCFSKSVPNYYYRMKSNTQFSNGSGCGNETASDKKMFRKYMIESCRYWVDEYHIDGFRYDLMGLHDVDTMNLIRQNLDQVSSKILMYGEPWAAEWNSTYTECGLCPKSSIASRITQLNSRVGMFNDKYRDAIKGDTDNAGKGFVQGTTSANTATIVSGVKGKNYSAQTPAQTVAYADAHDNLILWDKILKSNGSSSYAATSESSTEKYRTQVREVMTLLMTSQGIPFMTAGSEFGRTKKGDKNSYKSNDSINQIDWSRVSSFSNLAQYYKGLLQIRKNYAPLKGASFATPSFQSSSGDVVAYTYSNSTSGQWGKLCVLVNGGSQAWPITLNGSGWTIVAKDKQAGLTSLGTVSGSSYSIPAKSSAILVESSTFNNLKVTEKFGTLTINHVDDKGTVLKTSTAKYRAGSKYHTLPDTTLLFDYNLTGSEGSTSGTIAADTNTTVTYKYSNAGIISGYLNVSYVDESGTAIKDPSKKKLRAGDTYDVAIPTIQGYQLDTDKFPANIKGEFTGEDINIKFVFKPLDSSTIKVHYLNSNNWPDVMLYAYRDDGTEPNGAWATNPKMTSEGSNMYVGTVNAAAAYVMFHTSSTTAAVTQEPGQGENGYYAVGEIWVKNKVLTFNSKMIVSHIDLKTGQKIADDQITTKSQTSSSTTYTTSPISGRTDVIAPINASGTYLPGTFNVVYLYGDPDTPLPTVEPTTADPDTSTEPTTEPEPTQPDPGKRILVGDVNFDGVISVADATLVQQAAAEMVDFDKYETIAADCNGDGIVSVADATLIQKYAAEFDEDLMLTGTYVGTDGPTDPQPTNPEPTDPEPTDPEPTDPEPTEYEEHSFLLTDNFSWGTAYVYAWDGNGDPIGGEWPGSNMAEKQTNDYGEVQFVIHVPAGAAGIVVHNGNGAQTEDITDFTSYTGYWMDGTKDSLGHYMVIGWN